MERPEAVGGVREFEEEIPGDLDWAEGLVEEALLAGATEAEVYTKTSATSGIVLSRGYATLTGGSDKGVALRLFDGKGGVGHAYSSWAETGRRREMIQSALTALRESGERRPGLAAGPAPRVEGELPRPEGIADPRVVSWTAHQKREMLEAALREASRGHPAGTSATYRDGISRIALANSRGFKAGYVRTLSLVTLTRAGNGGPTLHADRVSPGPDPEGAMETAAGLARLQAAGQDEEVEWDDLLVEAPAAACVTRHLLSDLVEDPAGAGESGEVEFRRLASEAVTVVDDGLLAGGVGSAPFDGEGNATGRLTLVKAGVRIDRLRSLRAGESGRPGSAVRASYRDLPGPGGTNLFIVPGDRPAALLLAEIESGFLLAALEGDVREGRSGPGRSRFRGMGWQVRDGTCVGPCRRIVFRSEPADLLEGILRVSEGVHFSLRQGVAVGTPDLLIRRRR